MHLNKRAYQWPSWLLLVITIVVTAAVYWPGLSGGWLFDDYPNIVENAGVHPTHIDIVTLINAALSSPSSEFKRPMASLSFALNYLLGGLDSYGYKLVNVTLHLLNGVLVFFLARGLLYSVPGRAKNLLEILDQHPGDSRTYRASREATVAALIASAWMLLPINLTGVLYVVQRMESMANLFVLTGLIGYVAGRRRSIGYYVSSSIGLAPAERSQRGGFILCMASITVPTIVGVLAKETAVMLPLYALLIEWILFGFRTPSETTRVEEADNTTFPTASMEGDRAKRAPLDRRIIALFIMVLLLPMVAGVAWLLPSALNPATWSTRDFTLGTRLLSEARIVSDYVVWTLLPTPGALSFYHDNFHISTGLLAPWTTLASMIFLAAMIVAMFWLRRRRPLVALGIGLFLGCQLLTGTIIPLELIYEHRNYFASFGLMLALVPLLAAPARIFARTAQVTKKALSPASLHEIAGTSFAAEAAPTTAPIDALPMVLPRYALLAGLMLCWAGLTALTAYAWGNPLRLAQDLALRAPDSPRAEYELGRTYIIYSHYDPASPFTKLAYAPLEKAAALPDASILPEQALIFMNSRMHLPLKDKWWNSLIAKLRNHALGVQDESSLAALTKCAEDGGCVLPHDRMVQAFTASLAGAAPSARLLATYGDYAWNVLGDHALGLRMIRASVQAAPEEPAYRITLVRMLEALGKANEASEAISQLETLNLGGRLDNILSSLRALPGMHISPSHSIK